MRKERVPITSEHFNNLTRPMVREFFFLQENILDQDSISRPSASDSYFTFCCEFTLLREDNRNTHFLRLETTVFVET